MSAYAAGTEVAADRSRSEIERILARYGADQFSYGYDSERAIIAFRAHGRAVRLVLPLPDLDDRDVRYTPTGKRRADQAATTELEREVRRRWRSLALFIKAKLEAIKTGLSSFEEEFLPYTLLPDGTTVGDYVIPQVAHAYETGEMPGILPAARAALPSGAET